MAIATIELCSSRDVGQGGVGGARKCDLADIGATMVKCCDDARRESALYPRDELRDRLERYRAKTDTFRSR